MNRKNIKSILSFILILLSFTTAYASELKTNPNDFDSNIHRTAYMLRYLLSRVSPLDMRREDASLTVKAHASFFYQIYAQHKAAKEDQQMSLGDSSVYPYFCYGHDGKLRFTGFIKMKDDESSYLVKFRQKRLTDKPFTDFKVVDTRHIDETPLYAVKLTRREQRHVKTSVIARPVKRDRKSSFKDEIAQGLDDFYSRDY